MDVSDRKYKRAFRTTSENGCDDKSPWEPVRRGFDRARDQFAALLPETHRKFLEGLEVSVCLGDYLFVHAGVRLGVALENQREEDLLWIRDEFTGWSGGFGKIVVHGHSISEKPELEPNRINVDTGAYMTNHLTCAVLDGAERAFLQTGIAPVSGRAPGLGSPDPRPASR